MNILARNSYIYIYIAGGCFRNVQELFRDISEVPVTEAGRENEIVARHNMPMTDMQNASK